jgi:DNA-binding winged helix-turn-helix (wHTH) protein
MKPTTDFVPHVPISAQGRLLLAKLLDKQPSVVTHAELMSLPNRRLTKAALEMTIYGLRKKLQPEGYAIICHRGLGYSLADSDAGSQNSISEPA